MIRIDGIVNKRSGICSKTAQKWLNCLGYKWKKVQKRMFFDGTNVEMWLNIEKNF